MASRMTKFANSSIVGFVRIPLALSFILHKFAKNSLLLDPAEGAAVVVKDIQYWVKGHWWRKDGCVYLHKSDEYDIPQPSDSRKQVEEVFCENEDDMDNAKKSKNDKSSTKDSDNMKNSESESAEHSLECQGCGKNDGQFNCVGCLENF